MISASEKEQVDETFSLHKVEKLIIESLPSRNPLTTHNHNSVPSETLSLLKELKSDSFYFTSHLIKYCQKRDAFSPQCSSQNLAFMN